MDSKVTDKLFNEGWSAAMLEMASQKPAKKEMTEERRKMLIDLAVMGFEVDLSDV